MKTKAKARLSEKDFPTEPAHDDFERMTHMCAVEGIDKMSKDEFHEIVEKILAHIFGNKTSPDGAVLMS